MISSVERRSALRLGLDPQRCERALAAAQGLTQAEAENVFARSLVITCRLDVDVIVAEKEQPIRRSRILEYYHRRRALKMWVGWTS